MICESSDIIQNGIHISNNVLFDNLTNQCLTNLTKLFTFGSSKGVQIWPSSSKILTSLLKRSVMSQFSFVSLSFESSLNATLPSFAATLSTLLEETKKKNQDKQILTN